VPTCLSEHDREPAACDFALDDTTAGLDAMLHEEEEAAGNEAVTFWDATSAVCPNTPCEVVTDDGVVVFRDRHHLTQTYSRILSEELSVAIRATFAD
jgi:hypothetical protein